MNSVYFKRRLSLNTVKDAVNYLGEQKPNDLIRNSLIRARMCELCGSVLKSDYSTDELFILGLFSFMDAILDKKMQDILKHISLSEKISNGLLGGNKDFNKILNIVRSMERGNWDSIFWDILAGPPVEKKFPEFYFDAVSMTNSFFK